MTRNKKCLMRLRVKSRRGFKRIKNELSIKTFHARIYRVRKQKQEKSIEEMEEEEVMEEAEHKLKEVEVRTKRINDDLEENIEEDAIDEQDVKIEPLIKALKIWCETMDQNGEQIRQDGYVGLDDKQYKSFTLSAKSLFDGVEQHPEYKGCSIIEFSLRVLREKVLKIKERISEIHGREDDGTRENITKDMCHHLLSRVSWKFFL